MFDYLFQVQDYYICYKKNIQDILSFVFDKNVIFGNNILDQKSSQDYIIKLFSRAVAWKANKQDIITTLSTEANLLAISQITKEAINLFCLM